MLKWKIAKKIKFSISKLLSEDGDGVNSGVFIQNVVSESPAGRSGELFMGDRILFVNGTYVTEAVVAFEAFQNSNGLIRFVVQSLQSTKVCYAILM